MFTEAWDYNKSNSSENSRSRINSHTSRQTHPADMEKSVHSRARSNLISFVVLVAAIYVILNTAFIATLYHFTVKQAARIQTLEAIADELTERLYELETRFKAQATQESDQGGNDQERQERTEKRPTNKVTNACYVISGVCCQNFAYKCGWVQRP